MSVIEKISQRLSWAFSDETKQSLKATALIVNIGLLLPPSYVYPLPPTCTSEERLDFICFILKKETGIDYNRHEALVAHNILMGSHDTQEHLNLDCGIDKIEHYLNEFKRLRPQSNFAKYFSPTLLLPYRTVCSLCNKK